MLNRKGRHAKALRGTACRSQSRGPSVLDWGQGELSGSPLLRYSTATLAELQQQYNRLGSWKL